MTRVQPPPLSAGDVFLYLHENGAITLLPADHKSRFVPLSEALGVALACQSAGGQVYLGSDDGGLVGAAGQAIASHGIGTVPFDSPPPYGWDDGTNALMSAAAFGRDAILDDLIARGADVHAMDDQGATALHHAVGAGNIHAIDALAAAGSNIEQANGKGFTPYALALACGQEQAAKRLGELGATTTTGPGDTIRFRRSHYGTVIIWPAFAALALALAGGFLWPWSPLDLGVVLLVIVAYAIVSPPLAFWAGGVPRTMLGETLTLRRWTGATFDVDLGQVQFGASGLTLVKSSGPGGRRAAPWLLLAHPEGHTVTKPRTFRGLRVPANEEIQDLARRSDRYLVVILDGAHWEEVTLPVGNVLTACGVALSTSMRELLELARAGSVDHR